jgi:predicted O-methyltransferase YrrM
MRVRDVELRVVEASPPPEATDHLIHIHKPLDHLLSLDEIAMRVAPSHMVEIGIFHGGSTVYWEHRLTPRRLVAFDIAPGAPALQSYIRRHDLGRTVEAHFGVSQDDAGSLRRLIGADPIDLVIDDASHMYALTLAALECLLPLVRPGGAYVIEDWGWGNVFAWPSELWAEHPLMSPLIAEAMLTCGYGGDVIRRIEIDRGNAVLWRGATPLPRDGSFRLKDHYAARDFALPQHP